MTESMLGATFAITHGDQRVEVREVGASLHTYVVGDVAVVPPPPSPARLRDAFKGGRGQVLMPWPNRIRDGKYEVDGVSLQLPLSEPAKGNASHGFVRFTPFAVVDRSDDFVVLSARQYATLGYPFVFDALVMYRLGDDGLAVSMAATNVGERAMPIGIGTHPYFSVGSPTVDGCRLTFPAASTLVTDERSIPTGEKAAVDGTPLDFRAGADLTGVQADHCFTDIEKGADGRSTAVLEGNGRRLTVWGDMLADYWMIFTGDTLPEGERRLAVAIEPMTCAPDAFNNGLGLHTLPPGETFSTSWGARLDFA